ncbi:hypothetical protein B484DRAFT_135922 [Ochromonadaceae sp. CCMP2298]|nr:hypothetical protein B484DRAFT_135922 [Ochromonadaceae sp. CCMP2298]
MGVRLYTRMLIFINGMMSSDLLNAVPRRLSPRRRLSFQSPRTYEGVEPDLRATREVYQFIKLQNIKHDKELEQRHGRSPVNRERPCTRPGRAGAEAEAEADDEADKYQEILTRSQTRSKRLSRRLAGLDATALVDEEDEADVKLQGLTPRTASAYAITSTWSTKDYPSREGRESLERPFWAPTVSRSFPPDGLHEQLDEHRGCSHSRRSREVQVSHNVQNVPFPSSASGGARLPLLGAPVSVYSLPQRTGLFPALRSQSHACVPEPHLEPKASSRPSRRSSMLLDHFQSQSQPCVQMQGTLSGRSGTSSKSGKSGRRGRSGKSSRSGKSGRSGCADSVTSALSLLVLCSVDGRDTSAFSRTSSQVVSEAGEVDSDGDSVAWGAAGIASHLQLTRQVLRDRERSQTKLVIREETMRRLFDGL